MDKIFLLFLFLLSLYKMEGQTEKGMYLLGGKFLSKSTLSTNSLTNEENYFFTIQSEIGLFVTKKNLIGTQFSLQLNNNKKRNLNSSNVEKQVDYITEWATFYRFYPLSQKRLGFFGEMQIALIGSSQNRSAFFNQFSARIGTGAYFFFRKNLAFEVNLSKSFYQTLGIHNKSGLIVNFSLVRNFKRPGQTHLAKLEDSYLFVRNFYYGLGIRQAYQTSEIVTTANPKFSINTGIFLASHWLIDLEFSSQRSNLGTRNGHKSNFFIESAFFIRLNEKGTYLRPATSFWIEDNGRIRNANTPLGGEKKTAYIASLELSQFTGDQLIFGGGTSVLVTKFGTKATHFQLNANLRLTYFITKDFAIEYKGTYFLNDKYIKHTEDDLNVEFSHINAELKLRHFFFQE